MKGTGKFLLSSVFPWIQPPAILPFFWGRVSSESVVSTETRYSLAWVAENREGNPEQTEHTSEEADEPYNNW